MNQAAYSQMISCFISIFCHISNSYRWLHVVRRIPLNLSELVSLLIVLIISLCTRKYLCGLCGAGFEQAKIFIEGAIIYFRIGGSWEKPGVTDHFFLKIWVTKMMKRLFGGYNIQNFVQ